MTNRSWCYTLNNYTERDQVLVTNWEDVTRHTCGRELGTETGTPHLQGAITFNSPKRFSGVRKLLPGAHWEVMAARGDQAFEYARKDNDTIVDVDNRRQGKRTDLDDAIETLKSEGIGEMCVQHAGVYVKYHGGMEKLAVRLSAVRNERPTVYWIHGPTGTGKTRLVHDIEPRDDIWTSGDDLKWFDGYDGQRVALFDDFRGDMCKFRWLLRLLDRYPVRVQVKGSSVQFRPTTIWITSAQTPSETYSSAGERLDQLTRRITAIHDSKVVGWDSAIRAFAKAGGGDRPHNG